MMNLNCFGKVKTHASLTHLNTYHIQTKTHYLVHPSSIPNLVGLLNFIREHHLPYFILGNGSNVVLSDTEYPGVIIKLDELKEVIYHNNEVTVSAGVMIQYLCNDIIKHGLKGLEWASGIPGTVGGCIYGNAEAYKVSTFDNLKSINYLQDGIIKTKKKEEIFYTYRDTYFKSHPECIILSGTFVFEKGNKEESLNLIKDRLSRRLSTQPLEYPSAGSVFRNPNETISSGKLIDDLDLKGLRVGDAMVSEKHANFIINIHKATGKDIKSLIQLVHDKVLESNHIDLILEQEFKNW